MGMNLVVQTRTENFTKHFSRGGCEETIERKSGSPILQDVKRYHIICCPVVGIAFF
jgi:hypothetical protein